MIIQRLLTQMNQLTQLIDYRDHIALLLKLQYISFLCLTYINKLSTDFSLFYTVNSPRTYKQVVTKVNQNVSGNNSNQLQQERESHRKQIYPSKVKFRLSK